MSDEKRVQRDRSTDALDWLLNRRAVADYTTHYWHIVDGEDAKCGCDESRLA